MSALNTNPVGQYRARAHEAREKAATETDKRVRAALLTEAGVWDRMANYEEKYPSAGSKPGCDEG
jgi:hypothetical protein